MLKNTELLKHSKITLQHVSVYVETIFRELQSVQDQRCTMVQQNLQAHTSEAELHTLQNQWQQ